MGRPKAPDILREDAAAFVREKIRESRSLTGVTNRMIAKYLELDVRQVTSALVDASRLRASKAGSILDALSALGTYNREAQNALEVAKAALRFTETPPPRFIAALIPKSHVDRLATSLAEALAKRPGIGQRRRRWIEQALLAALSGKRDDLADSFVHWFRIHMTSATAVAVERTLRELGDPESMRTIFRAGPPSEHADTAMTTPNANLKRQSKRGRK